MTLQQTYTENIIPALMKDLDIHNKMAVPKIAKVVVNIGLKEAVSDKGVVEKVLSQMTDISGQKPKVTRAKKAIANFKLRQGDVVGIMTTLRGKRMYDFVTKLLTVALPRVRDFQGVHTTFDGVGNYSLGLTEQIIFPEIEYSKIDKIRGLEITFVIKNSNPTASKRLLELMGMPFKKG
jgi:large subunit ribosomal protein L5